MVFSHQFEIDLNASPSEHCASIESGNAAGIRFEITPTLPVAALDSDGDGFTNLDEVYGVDTNCDGQADVVLDRPVAEGGLHDMLADPNKPDIYVEVDWMDCAIPQPGQTGTSCAGILDDLGNPDMRSFEPDWLALDSVTQAFSDHGINLHIMPGEAIPAMGEVVGNSIGLSDTLDVMDPLNPDLQDAKLVWDLYFGKPQDRIPAAINTTVESLATS